MDRTILLFMKSMAGLLLFLTVSPVLSAPLGEETSRGDLEKRLDRSLSRVLEGGPPIFTADFVLADAVPEHSRRFTEFSGDVSGRYLDALSAVAAHLGLDVFADLREIAGRLSALQKEDGHFGEPLSQSGAADSDMAILWGNGRMLVGLLEYHRLTGDPDALAAARRLGDFLTARSAQFNSDRVQQEFSQGKLAVGYICWTQQIEGLVTLFERTQERRYLDLAAAIARRTRREPRQHSHGFLSSLRGIVRLYEATGEVGFLRQALDEWEGIIESGNRLLSGAVPEFLDDLHYRTEGCSEADWLRFNLQLWKLTEEGKYLEEAERTLFNEFSLNQFAGGDFGHHELFPPRRGAEPPGTVVGYGPYAARAWWCCTFHGLRAFPEVMSRAMRLDEDALSVDLPVDGRLASEDVEIRSKSTLSRDSFLRIDVVRTSRPLRTVSVRLPAWCRSLTLSNGDRSVQGRREGDRVEYPVELGAGDSVWLKYEMVSRAVRRETGEVAFFHGPWLLAVDEATSPFFFDEPFQENRVIVPGSEKELKLQPDIRPDLSGLSEFSIPVAHFRLSYRPGGYPQQPAEALLRPLAEATRNPSPVTRIFWFNPAQ